MITAGLKQCLRLGKNSQRFFRSGRYLFYHGLIQKGTKSLFAVEIAKTLQPIVKGYPGFVKSSFAPITNTKVDACLSYLFDLPQLFKYGRTLRDKVLGNFLGARNLTGTTYPA